MKKVLLFTFALVVILNSCIKTSPNEALLKKADSLLIKEEHEYAFDVLKNINKEELNEEETAYYNLLKTQTLYCLYIPATSDSAVNNSINLYQKNGDKTKLARAYYYKGAILYSDFNKPDEAMIFTKKAEKLANELKDYSLCSKIYDNIALINCYSGNLNTALHYSKLALSYSYKSGNKAMTCASLDRVGYIFNAKEMLDSSFFYMKKAIPYIKHLKKEEQSEYLANISAAFSNQGDTKNALHYIKKSLAIKPTSHAYLLYGSILIEQGKEAEAWALWNKAIHTDNIALKAEVMQWMSDYKKEKGEYKEASLLADSISILKDSLKRMQKAETIMQIQKDIEKDEADHRAYIRTRLIAAAAVVPVIVLMAFGIYHARRMNKAKSAIADNQKLVDKYTEDLERLAKSNKTNEREINRLNRKICELRDRNSEILGHGRQLWDEIMAGNTTAKWHKADFEAVVEHVRTKHPDVVAGIENRYSKLTPGGVLYLLLAAEGMDDEGIQHAMNLSPGALRTMKYRMKKNETANNEL